MLTFIFLWIMLSKVCLCPQTYIQDDEFHEIMRSGERIEFLYGHFFDETIINEDLEMAFEQLVEAVTRAENESLWYVYGTAIKVIFIKISNFLSITGHQHHGYNRKLYHKSNVSRVKSSHTLLILFCSQSMVLFLDEQKRNSPILVKFMFP
jgi:hypothetical protein